MKKVNQIVGWFGAKTNQSLKIKGLCFLGMLALASSSFAATGSWTGNSNGNWNVNGNWSAAFPNATGETATFNGAGNGNTTISMNGVSIAVGSIVFDTSSAAGYTFNAGGGSLTLNNAITVNSNVGAVTQTFNNVVNLSSTSALAVTNNSTSASINLAGGVDNASAVARTVTFSGSGNGGTVNGLTQTGGGALSLTFNNSAGIWNVTGTNSATGALIISGAGGTRVSSDLSGTSSTNISGLAQINNSLSNGGLSAITQSGTIQAFGADRTINTGTHTLNASTFSGSQSLTIGSVATMGGASGSITNNIVSGKSLTFNSASNFSLSESATNRIRVIGGSGNTVITSNVVNGGTSTASGITKQGSGTLQLSGNNTYAGATQVDAGVLRLDSANALSGGIGTTGGTSHLVINGGVIGLGNGDFTRSLGNNGVVTAFRWGGSAGGGFAAYGADRNVNIGGASANIAWGATNFVQAGQTLVFGAADATHKVTYQNGLNLASGARTIQVDNGSGAVDAELSGVISSTVAANGSLTKTGLGTLNLSNANTYTGQTTVSAGTLLVNGSLAGGADVSVGAALGGSGTIAGATTISGSLRPGNSIGNLTVTNDVTWNGGDSWVFELGTSAASLALANSGSSTQDLLTLTGAGNDFLKGTGSSWTFDFAGTGVAGWYKIVDWASTTTFVAGDFTATNLASGLSASFSVDSGTSALYLNVSAIPEPSTYAMLGIGLVSLWALRRKKFKA